MPAEAAGIHGFGSGLLGENGRGGENEQNEARWHAGKTPTIGRMKLHAISALGGEYQ